jgi:uncharacterized membrane protein
MRAQTVVGRIAASVAAGLFACGIGMAALSAATQHPQTLIYAVYDGQDTAGKVFASMKSAQGAATGEVIESYAVVSKDAKGKVKVRDQRKRDAAVGSLLGGVIGLIGGPMGIAAGASAGGSIGYLTGDAVGIPREKVDSMKASLVPNSSALVVVLDDRWVTDVERQLKQAETRDVIASRIANGGQ